MDLFTQLFGGLLLFVYHCFDRIVINGDLSGLSRPEQVVHFFRQILGVPILSKELLSQRTVGSVYYVYDFEFNNAGIKIHETRIIRLLEVLLQAHSPSCS